MSDLVKAGNSALAAAMDYGDNAGSGFEGTTAADTQIPFLVLLQGISPQVNGKPDERVKGAQSGMFYNTLTGELFDGEAGVIIQPCAHKHVFVEWKPKSKGGGFVGIHALDAEVVRKAQAEQEFGKYKNGENDLTETYYVAALIHRDADLGVVAESAPEPVVLTFKSTSIKPWKTIFTRMYTFKKRPPLFAHRLLVTSSTESNEKGTFSNWVLKPLVANNLEQSLIPAKQGEDFHPLLVAGKAFQDAYLTGAVKANENAASAADGSKKDADIPF